MAPRAGHAAVLTLLLLAAPAAAQPAERPMSAWSERWPVPPEEKVPLAKKGVSLPVIEYSTPDGRIEIRRGIVASVEVAPNTLVGVGLFETLPRNERTSQGDPLGIKPTRSRSAAAGISFRF